MNTDDYTKVYLKRNSSDVSINMFYGRIAKESVHELVQGFKNIGINNNLIKEIFDTIKIIVYLPSFLNDVYMRHTHGFLY